MPQILNIRYSEKGPDDVCRGKEYLAERVAIGAHQAAYPHDTA